jgi:hypothetical protein
MNTFSHISDSPLKSLNRFRRVSRSPKWIRTFRIAMGILIAGLFLQVGFAFAHERIEIGPYAVIVGWRNEPAIVGERNSILFQVSEDGEIIEHLESTVDAEIIYAGRIFRANITPADAEGWYAIEFLPTVRGQYTLRLVGSINDLEIDELIEPEEVLPPAILEFPESQPDTFKLQESVDNLDSKIQMLTIVAIAGVVLGVLGIGISLATLVRRRSQ